ncbi:MAG: ABC transporter substrate-binding protein [Thiolinea sp.]
MKASHYSTVTHGSSIYNRFRKDYQAGITADVVISSAMDLQITLVNEGYADRHDTETHPWLPEWAQWRNEAFGFTYEPAVLVYNQKLLTAEQIPENRFQLLDLLNEQREFFTGRIGTYDIARSGLGYLFASQEAEQASTWGRLVESMRRVNVRLYENTGTMLDAVRNGELLMAYNVLGSYAFAYAERHPELKLQLLNDYTLVMSRVAFVSRRARNKKLGHLFLDYLLSERAQQLLATEARLYPIHPAINHEVSFSGLERVLTGRGPFKTIKLGPALLTYQDRMKKHRFLQEWKAVLE